MATSRWVALFLAATIGVAVGCSSREPLPFPSAVHEGSPSERTAGHMSEPPLVSEPVESASPAASLEPASTPRPSGATGTPYKVIGASQQPGTILFGWIENGALDPFVGWPDAGLGIEYRYAFGAYWGQPLGATRIQITLYRVRGGVLNVVWTDTKSVDKDATGYLDTLSFFREPGLYRLEVARGPELIAWALTQIAPKCTENCSGG